MAEVFQFEGGPLHGQTLEFEGTATWWGFRYDKDGIKGEYNTSPVRYDGEGTYKTKPYRLYWSGATTPKPSKPDWELSEDDLDTSGEDLEDHIERLMRAQNG